MENNLTNVNIKYMHRSETLMRGRESLGLQCDLFHVSSCSKEQLVCSVT